MFCNAWLRVSRNEAHRVWKRLGEDVYYPKTYRVTGKVEAKDYPHLAPGK